MVHDCTAKFNEFLIGSEIFTNSSTVEASRVRRIFFIRFIDAALFPLRYLGNNPVMTGSVRTDFFLFLTSVAACRAAEQTRYEDDNDDDDDDDDDADDERLHATREPRNTITNLKNSFGPVIRYELGDQRRDSIDQLVNGLGETIIGKSEKREFFDDTLDLMFLFNFRF